MVTKRLSFRCLSERCEAAAAVHELNVNVSNIAVVAHHKSGTYAAMLLIGALCCPEAPLLVDNLWWRAWHLEGCSQRCADRSIFLYVDGLELEKEHQVTGHDPAWLRGCEDAACNQRLPNATCDLRVVHFMRHPVDMLRSGYLYHRTCPNVTPRRGTDGVLYRNVIPDGWRGTDLCLQAPGSPPPASPGHFSELRRRWGSQLNRHEVAGALGLAPEACAPLCNLLAQAPTQQGVWAEALRSVRAGDGAASLLRAHATLAEGQSACLASPPNGRARARVARLVPVCLHAATPTAAMQHDGTFVATWTNVAAQLGMSEAARVRLLGQLRANHEARKADEARPNGADKAELNAHARAALRQLLAGDASLQRLLDALPCAEADTAAAVPDDSAGAARTRVGVTGHGVAEHDASGQSDPTESIPMRSKPEAWEARLRRACAAAEASGAPDSRSVLLGGLLARGGAGAEVGVFRGDRAAALILGPAAPSTYHLIDPWRYQPEFENTWYGGSASYLPAGVPRMGSQADMDALGDAAIARVQAAAAAAPPPRPRVVAHRNFSADALASANEALPAASLDWVYVDGNHHFHEVFSDLILGLAKLRVGGLIIGDDLHWPYDAASLEAAREHRIAGAPHPVLAALRELLTVKQGCAVLLGTCREQFAVLKSC